MTYLDWVLFVFYFVGVLSFALYQSRKNEGVEGFFLGNRSMPWWAIGLSVMATQASAITFIGTTGQAFDSGMEFVQFYLALPFAMVVLCIVFVPFFYRARVFTAYEYLEQRFDGKTRALTGFLFLVSRGMGAGIILYAPAIVLSVILGWDERLTIMVMAVVTVAYTMAGGITAVIWTDVVQMLMVFGGIAVALIALFANLPGGGWCGGCGLHRWDPGYVAECGSLLGSHQYLYPLVGALWGVLPVPGLFRHGPEPGSTVSDGYLPEGQPPLPDLHRLSQSADAGPDSLHRRPPLCVLSLQEPPWFSVQRKWPPLKRAIGWGSTGPSRTKRPRSTAMRRTATLELLEARDGGGDVGSRQDAIEEYDGRLQELRSEAKALVSEVRGTASNDVNYVFPTYIINFIPTGLLGILIAVIFAAAMSSLDSEITALSSATVMDFYRRWFRPEETDAHYLRVSRLATLFWGLFAFWRGTLRRAAGISHRSREPDRILLLRIPPGRLPPGLFCPPGHGYRSVGWAPGGHGLRLSGLHHHRYLLALLQRGGSWRGGFGGGFG